MQPFTKYKSNRVFLFFFYTNLFANCSHFSPTNSKSLSKQETQDYTEGEEIHKWLLDADKFIT